jgi:hypothetical protein
MYRESFLTPQDACLAHLIDGGQKGGHSEFPLGGGAGRQRQRFRVTHENSCQPVASSPLCLARLVRQSLIGLVSVTYACSMAHDQMGHRSRNQALEPHSP